MTVYRVGLGQTPSGKILDRKTEWYTDYATAVRRAIELNKPLFERRNNRRYIELIVRKA